MRLELYNELFGKQHEDRDAEEPELSTAELRVASTEDGMTTIDGEEVHYFIFMDDPEIGRQTLVLQFADHSRFAAMVDPIFANVSEKIAELEQTGKSQFEASAEAHFNTAASRFLLSEFLSPILDEQD